MEVTVGGRGGATGTLTLSFLYHATILRSATDSAELNIVLVATKSLIWNLHFATTLRIHSVRIKVALLVVIAAFQLPEDSHEAFSNCRQGRIHRGPRRGNRPPYCKTFPPAVLAMILVK